MSRNGDFHSNVNDDLFVHDEIIVGPIGPSADLRLIESRKRIAFWEMVYANAVHAGHSDPDSVAEGALDARERFVQAEIIRLELEREKTKEAAATPRAQTRSAEMNDRVQFSDIDMLTKLVQEYNAKKDNP